MTLLSGSTRRVAKKAGTQGARPARLRCIRADLRANPDPVARMVVLIYRFGAWTTHLPALLRPVFAGPYVVLNLFLLRLLAGVDVSRYARIGPGLRLFHGGRGIAIHKNASLGARVKIYQGVAIGQRTYTDDRAPSIGDDVTIWPKATIAGAVFIGDRAVIGAHALVLEDIPAGGRALGPRATIIEP